ncbi:class I SAM-dependent methyltransferase [Paenibacillus sp. MBLB4367]|uniref:class I SAM-dependent methyltransferase n=1 Tax=Paenibacillus sp. MBLB4367 TaxID=3384767 RepID=UPI0039080625
MEKVLTLLKQLIGEQSLLQATLSNPRRKDAEQPSKVKAKPVLLKGQLRVQFAYTVGPQERHENVEPGEAAGKLTELLRTGFKQALVQAKEADYQILVNRQEKAQILKKQATKKEVSLTHNRQKRYVLEEGKPVPFLVELGVMNGEGKVLAAKYDKFRQINRFLEMVDDVAPHLAEGRKLHIIDFGCGKSYLTFALYHYLTQVRGLDIDVTGLDLKADVIAHCESLARRLGYDGLRFLVGDISRYTDRSHVDMVVTLHACDTATDAALEKAVRWGADVILSVPCCQHELFGQIESQALAPLLTHGILKERFAALATDAARARLLELVGYRTQMLEFIDLEHTPKNLLIRAVKQAQPAAALRKLAVEYREYAKFLHISPYLERALQDKLAPLLSQET